MEFLFLTFLTLAGLCVGSFLNVLAFRIPRGEEFIRTPSHCMQCGHRLRWFELIPVASWLAQRGKCRSCGAGVSAQYPLVEAANGLAWLLTGLLFPGDPMCIFLYCALFSVLLVIALVDFRTFVIPGGLNLAILLLGVIRLASDPGRWKLYLIGMVSVSLVFFLLWLLTRGAGIGMGDVKLVAVAGLLLGWPRMILAVLLGSLSGAVIHSLRMKRGTGSKLAFGPYLAAGIWLSALLGDRIISAYLGLFGL